MQKLGETLGRITKMPGEELRTRAAQEICKRWDLLGHLVGRSFEPVPNRRFPRTSDAKFFFSSNDISGIAAALRKSMPNECAGIVEYAEQVCRGEFDLLGFKKLSFGSPINWHLDPVRGKCAPGRIWYRVPYMNPEETGDSKVIWELNRHQHLVTLAKAHCLTGESRFVQEIYCQWDAWHRDNPYPVGINWASSLEVGFRALSWLWTWHLLKDTAVHASDFKQRLWRSLAVHGRHIELYLSTYSSPNTHLLGEVVALFFLGLLCPELDRSSIWKATAWRFIEQESKRQVLADGMHFEQSTYYHVYALDFLLHARLLAARNGMEISADFDDALVRMLDWLGLVGQCRALPHFGDDDGGRVFDGRRNRGEHLLDPLSTGAILFRRSDWKAVAGALREETLWLLGSQAVADYENLKGVVAKVRSQEFADSGTYVMTEDDGARQQLTVDAGRQGAFSSGHGHADALSVHLSINGREWLVDPGTYSYLPGAGNREAFRGTAAHNTLLVDRVDQAISTGPFSWKALPEVVATSLASTGKFEFWEGQHSGYRRLPNPVLHKRSVFHLRSGFWFFHDRVLGQGPHHLEVAWHFGPEIALKKQATDGCFVADPEGIELALLTAGEGSGRVEQGWYSPVYGSEQQVLLFRYSQNSTAPSAIATVILPEPEKFGKLGTLAKVGADCEQSDAHSYRYIAQGKTHQLVFADGAKPWQIGPLASDARLLYCCFLDGGQLCRFFLSSGTFFRFGGKLLFEAPQTAAAYEWEGEARSDLSGDHGLPDDSTLQPMPNSFVRSRK